MNELEKLKKSLIERRGKIGECWLDNEITKGHLDELSWVIHIVDDMLVENYNPKQNT